MRSPADLTNLLAQMLTTTTTGWANPPPLSTTSTLQMSRSIRLANGVPPRTHGATTHPAIWELVIAEAKDGSRCSTTHLPSPRVFNWITPLRLLVRAVALTTLLADADTRMANTAVVRITITATKLRDARFVP